MEHVGHPRSCYVQLAPVKSHVFSFGLEAAVFDTLRETAAEFGNSTRAFDCFGMSLHASLSAAARRPSL